MKALALDLAVDRLKLKLGVARRRLVVNGNVLPLEDN